VTLALSTDRTASAIAARALAPATAVAVAACMVLPRAAPVMLVLLAIVWLFAPGPGRFSRPAVTPLLTAVVLFAAYAAVTAAWSIEPREGVLKVCWLLLAVLAGATMLATGARLGAADAARIRRALVIAFAIGLAYVGCEVLLGGKLLQGLFNLFEALRPVSRKHMAMRGDAVQSINPYVFNRNMGAVVLLMWPALAAGAALVRAPGVRWVLALLFVATLAVAARSEHESSAIAIAVSGIVFVVARLLPRIGRPLVLVGWLAATLLMVPVAMLAYTAGMHKADAIPVTARARIILWDYTARQVLHRPLLGVGIASTRTMDEKHAPAAQKRNDEVFAQRTGRHAHNVYLQTWYELGAVGALLLLAAGIALWRAVVRLPEASQPYALAAFPAAMVIGSFTWGLWQEWYLSLFTLSAVTMGLAARAPDAVGEARS